jgi:hypothetical protein
MVVANGLPFTGIIVNTSPLQIVAVLLKITGLGLTVIVNICAVPGQLLAVGVTVIVPVIGAFVVLVAVNAAIFPVPLAASPIVVLLFVHP